MNPVQGRQISNPCFLGIQREHRVPLDKIAQAVAAASVQQALNQFILKELASSFKIVEALDVLAEYNKTQAEGVFGRFPADPRRKMAIRSDMRIVGYEKTLEIFEAAAIDFVHSLGVKDVSKTPADEIKKSRLEKLQQFQQYLEAAKNYQASKALINALASNLDALHTALTPGYVSPFLSP